MSLIKANNHQIGLSLTATNNFTFYQPSSPDGTARIGNGNSGSVTDILTFTSAGNVGIGTSSPSYKLQVTQDGNLNATSAIANATAGTSSVARFLAISDAGNASFGMTSSSYTDITGAADSLLINTGSASGGMSFALDGVLKMKLDASGNLGLGVTPSAWSGVGVGAALDISSGGLGLYVNGIQHNAYYNGTNWIYKTTGAATQFLLNTGFYRWLTAPSGTAGNPITFTQAMTLNSDGVLLVGATSPQSGKFYVGTGDSNGWYSQFGSSSTGVLLGIRSSVASIGTVGAGSLSLNPDGGNVGIGTTNPTVKLQVVGQISNNLAAGGASITTTSSTTTVAIGNTGGMPYIQGYNSVGSNSGLAFYNYSAEVMRYDSSGNVGIGTSSPVAKFNVVGGRSNFAANSENFSVYLQYNSSTSGFYIGSPSADAMAFSASSGVERARIDSSGNLLVGTTTSGTGPTTGFNVTYAGGSTYSAWGHVSGTAGGQPWCVFSYNGTPIGSITQTGTTATGFNTTSDQRLKTNVQPSGSAIQSILDFPIDQFDWVADGSHQDFGAVAQKAINHIPEMVSVPADDDEMWGIDWSKAVPRLIKTIQELKAELDELKSQIGAK